MASATTPPTTEPTAVQKTDTPNRAAVSPASPPTSIYDVDGQEHADGLEAQAKDTEGGEPGGDAAGKAGVGRALRKGGDVRQWLSPG